MKKLFTILSIAGISLSAAAQSTYKDVAGIFYSRCASCHHENGGAPFSMMSYSQTYPYSASIKADISSGKMPPWSPDTSYTRFLHERVITAAEKNAIINWINAGALQGDTTLAPPAPGYSQYKLNGTPDLILQIPTFTSNPGTSDAYDCFSIPSGLTTDRIMRAFEIIPGNPGIVHHVVVSVDTTGTVQSDLSGTCFNQPGDFSIGTYVPGCFPTVYPGQAPLKLGMKIKAGSNIIIQIHYPIGTAGQQDSTRLRMFFYPEGETGVRQVYDKTFLQNWSLIIPPNTSPTFTAKYPSNGGLLSSLSLFASFAHGHKVVKSIINYADNGTSTIPLIRINKWDFDWQGFYTYPKMIKIPAGYTLHSSHTYDNTTGNASNPFNPPQTITAGTSTTNEMLYDAFQYLNYQAGDENIDITALLANDSLLNPTVSSVHENSVGHISCSAFPNPFSEYVRIGYELTRPSDISISIYSIYGNKIKTLSTQYNSAGTYSIIWNAQNENGAKVPAGVYFYTIQAGNASASGKIMLMDR